MKITKRINKYRSRKTKKAKNISGGNRKQECNCQNIKLILTEGKLFSKDGIKKIELRNTFGNPGSGGIVIDSSIKETI